MASNSSASVVAGGGKSEHLAVVMGAHGHGANRKWHESKHLSSWRKAKWQAGRKWEGQAKIGGRRAWQA